ncbi:hypothetical protein ASF61_04825 [Duganella sp. Leaf126]|uniref:chemotaxis protein CheW n=1 Tax=Duganella sp. Leaf126 TaxID=1736266 RepID=UPI000701A908|nr:chemotaxis protein CheW [Duganella sp. Leaf126]KQQ40119.1 hypothetical protein ASF61_04825 [Duganella sp. Leaf126]
MAVAQNHAAAVVQLAVATVGAVTIGIPVAAVLQALPLAGALHPLPRRQGALCGVADHGGALVPVVDLARWVEVGAAADAGADRHKHARILVLGDGRRTIGLRVDAVLGLTDVPAPTQVLHDQHPDEVFDTVVRSADLARVISVLDVGRLIALAAAWHAGADGASGAPDTGSAGGADGGEYRSSGAGQAGEAGMPDGAAAAAAAGVHGAAARPPGVLYALLAVGDARIAVPADEVAQVKRMPPLQPLGPAGGSNYCSWRNRKVAVLDTTRLLNLPAAANAPLLAIVERGDLALGLAVRAALELRTLAAPATGVATTVIDDDGSAIEVIDTATLLARVPEASISRTTEAAPRLSAATATAAAQRVNSSAYIVFQTDQQHATAIDPIEEILALAPAHVDGQEQLLPTIAWRGRPLPLVDLRPAGTPTPAGCDARIIVARSSERCTGYVVKHVLLLIPPNTGKLYRMALAGAGLVEFITTGAVNEQASYRTIDLARTDLSPAAA